MLFKFVYDEASPADQQPDSLKTYCSQFNKELKIYDLQDAITDAEETYILPVLGQTLYDNLSAAYASYPGVALTPAFENLLRRIQPALAYFIFFDRLILGQTYVSNQGPHNATSKDGTSIPPNQWRTLAGLRKSFEIASRRLDRLIGYLEKNYDSYSDWYNSEAYSKAKDLFFNSGTELSTYMPATSSRVVYLQLRPAIREAERRYILPELKQPFFDELKAAIKDLSTPLTADQEEVIDHIRWALIKWAKILAIPQLRLRIGETGLVEPDFDSSVDLKKVRPSREEQTRSLWVSQQEAGRIFLADLKTYLEANVDKFPTYKNSLPDYTLLGTNRPFLSDFNEDSSGVGSLL